MHASSTTNFTVVEPTSNPMQSCLSVGEGLPLKPIIPFLLYPKFSVTNKGMAKATGDFSTSVEHPEAALWGGGARGGRGPHMKHRLYKGRWAVKHFGNKSAVR